MPIKDKTGKKFGKITVLKLSKKKSKNPNARNAYWVVKCECGNIKEISSARLSNKLKSCGCSKESKIKVYPGKKFHYLKLIKKINDRYKIGKKVIAEKWLCKCKCGNFHEVKVEYLRNNIVKSCGCLAREKSAINNKGRFKFKINKNGEKEYYQIENLAGKNFGNFKVLGLNLNKSLKDKFKRTFWKVECICGKKYSLSITNLKEFESCGCLAIQRKREGAISKNVIINEIKKFIKIKKKAPTLNDIDGSSFSLSSTSIGERFGGIEKLLKEINFKGRIGNKYQFNEDYFNKINTPNKAYFLGLIVTDGSIHKNRNTLTINLQKKDKHILELLSKEVQIQKPLQFVKNNHPNRQDSYVFEINSPKIKKDLKKIGINPQKTLTTKFANNKIVPENLMRHYVRGVFDGDGSISPQGRIIITSGSKKFISEFDKYIEVRLKLDSYIRKRSKNNYNIEYRSGKNKERTKIFYNYFYKNVKECFLIRKKNIFDNIFK